MKVVRISIDEGMLRDLLAGRVVAPISAAMQDPTVAVQLALQDIGWDRMQKALDDAMDESIQPRKER
jgi:hypothetical protein